MRFYVAITDDSWFAYLAAKQPDEINFWRPSGNQSLLRLTILPPRTWPSSAG